LTYLNQTRPITSAYSLNIMRSVLNRLCQLGEPPTMYATYGTDTHGNIHQHAPRVLEHCARGRLRCVIVESTYHAGEVEKLLARWGVKVVGSHHERALSQYNFGADNGPPVEEGLRHLLGRGLRKVAFMAGKPWQVEVKRQMLTYLRVMEENRLAVRPGWLRCDQPPSARSGYEEFRRLWAMDDHPEAILIDDDIMALGATRAMVELGVSVPRELTVMVQTVRWSGLVFPVPVIALERDAEAVGVAGAEIAVRLLRNEPIESPQVWVKPATRIETAGLPTEAEISEPLQPIEASA
jgi:DNA-binding LacI/PurR family transcriptional regulator